MNYFEEYRKAHDEMGDDANIPALEKSLVDAQNAHGRNVAMRRELRAGGRASGTQEEHTGNPDPGIAPV